MADQHNETTYWDNGHISFLNINAMSMKHKKRAKTSYFTGRPVEEKLE